MHNKFYLADNIIICTFPKESKEFLFCFSYGMVLTLQGSSVEPFFIGVE